MFLLPIAERHRRSFWAATALILLLLQGLMPLPAVRQTTSSAVAVVSSIVLPPAQALAGRLAPARLHAAAPDSPMPPHLLREAERRAGAPPALLGAAWVEVPVARVDRTSHQLHLLGGSRLGLAPGQTVVFGREWLGRVVEVDAEHSVVRLWSAAGARAGATLRPPGVELRAVIEGRGRVASALLGWLEPHGEPEAGMQVYWRPGFEDLPALASLSLRLGHAEQAGDAQRGDAYWILQGELPAGAEGRVWVAVGAVAETLIAEPGLHRARSRLALLVDGVYGAEVAVVRVDSTQPVAVIFAQGRVAGRVVLQRGAHAWVRRPTLADWSQQAVRLSAAGAFEEEGVLWYSRGDQRLPRGLPLGRSGDPPVGLRGAMTALQRLPQPALGSQR